MDHYTNYFKNHSYGILLEAPSIENNKRLDHLVGSYINKNTKILEIGSGLGRFANYCEYKGVANYVGIEIDQTVADELAKRFGNYQITAKDAMQFFSETQETFDVIYLSHVFEHFTLEDGINLATEIYKHLSPSGVRINFMPNAGSLSGALGRYNDITHKIIYTSNSFNQVLQEVGVPGTQIKHFNVWPKNILKKFLAYIIGCLIAIDYHTFELMSVISK